MFLLLTHSIHVLSSINKFLFFIFICFMLFNAFRENTEIFFIILGLFFAYLACRMWYKWVMKKPKIKSPTPEKKMV